MAISLPKGTVLTEKNVRRNTIIQIVIATLAFVMFVGIWPMGAVKEHTISKQQAMLEKEYSKGALFQVPDKKLQGIRFTKGHINQITLYMTCVAYEKDDYVKFRIYDERFSCIYEEHVGCSQIMRDGYLVATPDMDVVVGQDYYYEILIPQYVENRKVTQQLILPVADKEQLAIEENQILYIDGIYNDVEALVADFDYTESLPLWKTMIYLCGIVVGALLIWILSVILGESLYGLYVKNVRAVKYILTAVSIILMALVFYNSVILGAFGGMVADKITYGMAVVVLFVILMCLIWVPRMEKVSARKSVSEQASSMWRNYIQSVAFGLLFYSLCLYVNAEREYIHVVNARWMLIFFGIACLMNHSLASLKNKLSYLWLLASGVISFVYCTFFVQADAEQMYEIKLIAGIVVVWGLVLINVGISFKKDFWKNISKPFFAIWSIFAILMYYWRAERTWIYMATLPFVVLLLYNMSAAGRNRFLRNITRGIFISFGIYMLYSLHHRPYNAWIFFRYGGIFYTVACAGMYLVVVAGAALGKVCVQCKNMTGMLRKSWKSLCVWGISISCILLTMSRTAMLTVAVTFVCVFAMAAFVYKKRISHMIKELCLLLMAVLICFPLTYSACRVIPAVMNEPEYSNFEKGHILREHNVFKGDAPNDMEKYMSIERYFAILLGRFNVASEQTIDNSSVTTDVVESNDVQDTTVGTGDETYSYVIETTEDISNGRFDIYMSYVDALAIEGHPLMELELEDGDKYAHAHSSYLQVAYDFGIPAGIVFLLLCAFTLWRSIILCIRYGSKYEMYIIAYSLVIVFGVMSVTEWAFHPCIPVGFAFLLMQMLLMQEPSDKKI